MNAEMLKTIEQSLDCSIEDIKKWVETETNRIRHTNLRMELIKFMKTNSYNKYLLYDYPLNIFMELFHKDGIKYTKKIDEDLTYLLDNSGPEEAISILKLYYKFKLSIDEINNLIGTNKCTFNFFISNMLSEIKNLRDEYIYNPYIYIYGVRIFESHPYMLNAEQINNPEYTYPKNLFARMYNVEAYNECIGMGLINFVNKLDELSRQLIILRFHYKLKYREIAEKTGIRSNYVGIKINKIIETIRHNWIYPDLRVLEALRTPFKPFYEKLHVSVDELDISTETFQKLTVNKIDTVGDILPLTYGNLINDFGIDSLEIKKIINKIQNMGFELTPRFKAIQSRTLRHED